MLSLTLPLSFCLSVSLFLPFSLSLFLSLFVSLSLSLSLFKLNLNQLTKPFTYLDMQTVVEKIVRRMKERK
jgi:hypothetical protein